MYDWYFKYVFVIIDVFYDYFFVLNWFIYLEQLLFDFILDVYVCLKCYYYFMFEFVYIYVFKMIVDNWFEIYVIYNGIVYIFRWMSYWVSCFELFVGVFDIMVSYFQELNIEFNVFFLDVIWYVKVFVKQVVLF